MRGELENQIICVAAVLRSTRTAQGGLSFINPFGRHTRETRQAASLAWTFLNCCCRSQAWRSCVAKLPVVVIMIFLFAFGASAQLLPKGNVFVGYSYNRLDLGGGDHANLNGWIGSAELKVFPFMGIVGDGSGHYG